MTISNKRLTEISAIKDEDIDFSDIPVFTRAGEEKIVDYSIHRLDMDQVRKYARLAVG